MTYIVRLALLLVLLVSCSSSSGSSDSSSGEAEFGSACGLLGLNTRVIGGEGCSNAGAASVVRFFTLDAAENVLGFCSGTLIAPNAVLTATHCFLTGRETFVVVVFGEGDNVEFANAVQISPAPGFRIGGPATGDRLFNDAAVLLLDRNVSSPVMPILVSRAPIVGEPGYVYGYGSTEVGGSVESVSADELRGGAMTIREVTPNHIFVEFDGSGVNVCKGDSGGPVVVEVNGLPALSGITSQGSNATCQAGDVTTFTNLQSDSVIAWLTDVVPNAQLR